MRNIIDSRISILLPFGFLIIIIAFFPVFSSEVGLFQYKGSIEDIKSDTISVNDTIVAMSIT
jgi:hypothetical protein